LQPAEKPAILSPHIVGGPAVAVDAKGRIWYGAQPYFTAGYIRVRTEAEKAAAPSR